jgi:ABC-type sugar transport system ATPase subunit
VTTPGKSGVVIRDLRKVYGDTVALAGLSLDARPGEILGIAGPNGAGKSTMVKILAGEVERDSGEVLVDGREWSPAFGADRVAVVHQEPQLFPNLTVGENIVAGREQSGAWWPRVDPADRPLLDELGITPAIDVQLGSLGLALQQRTEIARALVRDARLVLFDEPNSALTPEESAELFRLMRRLADTGHVVMLISHRLTELAANADRVGVIVDGRCVRLLEGDALTAEEIAQTIVRGLEVAIGRVAADGPQTGVVAPGLRFAGLTDRGGAFSELDFEAPAGAITALIGVEGSGAREIVRATAGLQRVRGAVEIAGTPVRPPRLAAHVAYVGADRASSLFTNLTVGENLVIRLDRQISGVVGLRRRRMRQLAEQLCADFRVKSDGIDIGIRSLSGGNQQKVAIASAVARRPEVLSLEEPTRGVDIASKAEIYEILRAYAAEGNSVVLFCTEIPEVFEVADRLHVVSQGRLSAPLEVAAFPGMEALAKAVASLERHGMIAA